MAYISKVNQPAEQETEGIDQKDRSTKIAIAVKCLKCASQLKWIPQMDRIQRSPIYYDHPQILCI